MLKFIKTFVLAIVLLNCCVLNVLAFGSQDEIDELRAYLSTQEKKNSVQYVKAKEKLNRLITQSHMDYSTNARLIEAVNLMNQEKYGSALYEIQDLIDNKQELSKSYELLAEFYERTSNNTVKIADCLKKSVASDENNVSATFKLAKMYLKQGKNILGTEYLRKTIDLSATNEYFSEIERIILNNVIPKNKYEANNFYETLGVMYYKSGRNSDAYYAFSKALTLHPADIALRYQLANLLYSAKHDNDALILFDSILKLIPSDCQVRNAKAKLLLRNGDIEGASKEYQTILTIYPASNQAKYGIYQIYKDSLSTEQILLQFNGNGNVYMLDNKEINSFIEFLNNIQDYEASSRFQSYFIELKNKKAMMKKYEEEQYIRRIKEKQYIDEVIEQEKIQKIQEEKRLKKLMSKENRLKNIQKLDQDDIKEAVREQQKNTEQKINVNNAVMQPAQYEMQIKQMAEEEEKQLKEKSQIKKTENKIIKKEKEIIKKPEEKKVKKEEIKVKKPEKKVQSKEVNKEEQKKEIQHKELHKKETQNKEVKKEEHKKEAIIPKEKLELEKAQKQSREALEKELQAKRLEEKKRIEKVEAQKKNDTQSAENELKVAQNTKNSKFNEYKKTIDGYLKTKPMTANIYIAIANTYRQANMPYNSIKYFQEAKKLEPVNSEIYYNIGLVYMELNRLEDAKENLEKSINLNNENKKAQNLLAFVNQKMTTGIINKAYQDFENKNYIQAFSTLDSGIRVVPNNAQLYYYRGLVEEAMNRNAASVIDFQKAIELNPGYYMAYYYLGKTYEKIKDEKSALVAYERFLSMEPDDKELVSEIQKKVIDFEKKYY